MIVHWNGNAAMLLPAEQSEIESLASPPIGHHVSEGVVDTDENLTMWLRIHNQYQSDDRIVGWIEL